jgi:periplasmic divalent cation tolerance protein
MYLQIMTTVSSQEAAQRLAETLVQERLVACAQILGGVTSIYWWQGKIQQGGEWLCLFKSHQALYPQLEQRLLAIHPYDTPELVATELVNGSRAYFDWLGAVLGVNP